MTSVKEIIEKMKEELREETSYKVVVRGDAFVGSEEIEGHAPTVVTRLAETLGRCIVMGTNEGRLEDAFHYVNILIRESAKREVMKNEKENIHTDSSDNSVLG